MQANLDDLHDGAKRACNVAVMFYVPPSVQVSILQHVITMGAPVSVDRCPLCM